MAVIRMLDDLVGIAASVEDEDIPKVLGKLEEVNAMLWSRLLRPARARIPARLIPEAVDQGLMNRLDKLEANELKGKRLLTVPEAARALSLRPSSLRAWIAARRIEYVRIGRRIGIRVETIERVLRDGTIPARTRD